MLINNYLTISDHTPFLSVAELNVYESLTKTTQGDTDADIRAKHYFSRMPVNEQYAIAMYINKGNGADVMRRLKWSRNKLRRVLRDAKHIFNDTQK